eukprot:m.16507 g.16507  ORF g.16507 m.16507 type:complete len:540 (+) comp26973_c0_seq1:46-1665(+)
MAEQQLRSRFHSEGGSKDVFDARDLTRVDEDDLYLDRFVQHHKGDIAKALEMLIKSLKWRKTFGVNDLSKENIEKFFFELGVGYVHGKDKKGNSVLILTIKHHKKDATRLAQLKRFVVFSLDEQARSLPPHVKLTVIFDMTDVGLAQVDMDFLRFFIDCFKYYFPNMLECLLVYNIPFMLQAVWKIVKSWLSEEARQKVKFVKKADILNYVEKDQLLLRFGGSDPFEYKFTPEEEEHEEGDLRSMHDTETEELLDDAAKKVHFEDERSEELTGSAEFQSNRERFISGESSDESGLSAKNGVKLEDESKMRRRHVNRFLRRGTPSPETVSLPGSPVKSWLLRLNPSSVLEFHGNPKEINRLTLTLTSLTTKQIAFKVKTTTPEHYYVKTCVGLIDPGKKADISIGLHPGYSHSISKDKFLVMCTVVTDDIKPSELSAFWRSRNKEFVEEHRLSCRFIPRDSPTENSGKDLARFASISADPLSHLTDKVESLEKENKRVLDKLEASLILQTRLFLAIFMLLLLVLGGVFRLWRFDPWAADY